MPSNSPPVSPPDASALDSRRLQLFVSSAVEESFAAAATRLSLCPSAVSHAIRGLEEDLGCALFRRIGPRVSLTRAGLRLLPMAEDVLRRMEDLRREVAVIESQTQRLRIVVPEPVCSGLLPTALADLIECFPAIALEILTEHNSAETEAAARRREVDLIFSTGEGPPDFVHRRILAETLNLYAAPFFALCRGESVETTQLKRHRLLTADAPAAAMVSARLLSGTALPSQVWHLPGTQSVIAMARTGLGIAVLPESAAAEAVSAGTLCALPYHGVRLERSLSAFWPHHSPPSWAAEVLLGLLSLAAGDRTRSLEKVPAA